MIKKREKAFYALQYRRERRDWRYTTNRVSIMRIEPEQTGNVIVFLTGEDLAYYDLTFRLLDAKGIATRRMAAELLSRIQEQTGIDFTKTRILIEAYPNGEGCICLLYTSRCV